MERKYNPFVALNWVGESEPLALMQLIKGKTVLDIGGGDGRHSMVWKTRGGFSPTIMDNAHYDEDTIKRLGAEGVGVINQDFFTAEATKKYDTVISLRSINPEAGLEKELRMANMRVISMVFAAPREHDWAARKRSSLAWLDGVIDTVEHSHDVLEAQIVLLLDNPDDKLDGKESANVVSLQELRKAWAEDRLCVWGRDYYMMLIVVDKKLLDAEGAGLPINLLRKYGYTESETSPYNFRY